MTRSYFAAGFCVGGGGLLGGPAERTDAADETELTREMVSGVGVVVVLAGGKGRGGFGLGGLKHYRVSE